MTWDQLREEKDLIIGVPDTYYNAVDIKQLLPDATVWEIATPRLFFRDTEREFNTLMFGVVGGSAWSLLYPDYVVVAPKPELLRVPLAFPLAYGDAEFELFMRNWIELRQRDGSIDKLFEYWMRGKEPNGATAQPSPWDSIFDSSQ
jgi:hypothetical protein